MKKFLVALVASVALMSACSSIEYTKVNSADISAANNAEAVAVIQATNMGLYLFFYFVPIFTSDTRPSSVTVPVQMRSRTFCRSTSVTILVVIMTTGRFIRCGVNEGHCQAGNVAVGRVPAISVAKPMFHWLIRVRRRIPAI